VAIVPLNSRPWHPCTVPWHCQQLRSEGSQISAINFLFSGPFWPT
jgi:hypothetical protein